MKRDLIRTIESKTISYELLMGLMGVGVAFGLSLPQDDNQYWDYTRSLKRHLNLVDDKYLELLEKSSKEWHSNNHNKNDNDKEPFKVPFDINIFSDLFKSVGEDVSVKKDLVLDALGDIPLVTSFEQPGHIIKDNMSFSYINTTGTSTVIDFTIEPDPKWSHISILNYIIRSGSKSSSGSISYNHNSDKNDFKFYQSSDGVHPMIGWVGVSTVVKSFETDIGKDLCYKSYVKAYPSYTTTEIEYSPIRPSGSELPSLPNIGIPNPSTSPEVGLGLEPPFNVVISNSSSSNTSSEISYSVCGNILQNIIDGVKSTYTPVTNVEIILDAISNQNTNLTIVPKTNFEELLYKYLKKDKTNLPNPITLDEIILHSKISGTSVNVVPETSVQILLNKLKNI